MVWDSSREKRAIKIGKREDNDIVLQDSRVSRNHAVIVKEGEKFYIYDNGSTNGTYLNNKRLPPKVRKALPKESKVSLLPFTLTCIIAQGTKKGSGTRIVLDDDMHF